MATRFYFHAATNGTANLPTTEQSSLTVVASGNADALTLNRSMDTTIGTSQASNAVNTVSSGSNNYYYGRFVSQPIYQTSIAANTWTYNFATHQTNANANFPCTSNNQAVRITCYVWRPGTGKIGNILDGTSAATVDEGASNTLVAHHVTFSGAQVNSTQAGDVIVFEVWFVFNPAASTIPTSFRYDGTTVNTTDNATVSNHASFLETPENINLTDTTPVSETNIHKYNIVNNVAQTNIHKYNIIANVLQTNIHKYHILSAIAQTSIHKYNILNNVLQTSIHKYNIIQNILQTSIHKYNLVAFAIQTSIHKYGILNAVAQTSIHKYNLLQNILQTSIHKYRLFQNVLQASIHKYNLIAYVLGTTSIHKYRILNTILQTSVHKYNLLSNLLQTSIQKYNILQNVLQSSIHKYNLRVFTAIATSIHKYNLLQYVQQTSIQKYNLLQNVLQSSIHKYNLIAYILATSIHKYDIINVGTVIAELISKYNIFANVANNSIHKYGILNNVIQTSIQKYHLFQNVLQTSIHKYDILVGALTNVLATSIHKYDILQNILQTSVHKYGILNSVLQSSIHKYRLLQNILQSSIHKYNMGGKVIALSRHLYNILIERPEILTSFMPGGKAQLPKLKPFKYPVYHVTERQQLERRRRLREHTPVIIPAFQQNINKVVAPFVITNPIAQTVSVRFAARKPQVSGVSFTGKAIPVIIPAQREKAKMHKATCLSFVMNQQAITRYGSKLNKVSKLLKLSLLAKHMNDI